MLLIPVRIERSKYHGLDMDWGGTSVTNLQRVLVVQRITLTGGGLGSIVITLVQFSLVLIKQQASEKVLYTE